MPVRSQREVERDRKIVSEIWAERKVTGNPAIQSGERFSARFTAAGAERGRRDAGKKANS